MFKIQVSRLGPMVGADDTVLQADTKPELRKKVGKYLSNTYPERWNAMSDEQRDDLKSRAASMVEAG